MATVYPWLVKKCKVLGSKKEKNQSTLGGYLQTQVTIIGDFQPEFTVAICVDEENAFCLNKKSD